LIEDSGPWRKAKNPQF